MLMDLPRSAFCGGQDRKYMQYCRCLGWEGVMEVSKGPSLPSRYIGYERLQTFAL